MNIRTILLIALLAVVLVSTSTAPAQDPVEANPGKYTVLFENDRVRLLEYRDNPGDTSVLHEHPAHLVYSLSAWEREFIFPDGTTRKAEAKTGDAFWAPADRHSAKNIGSTLTHALIFELKDDSTHETAAERLKP